MAYWKSILFTSVFCWILLSLFDKYMKCNWSSIVGQLCSTYEEGRISGPLCPDLCRHRTIQFDECLTLMLQKEVFTGEWQGREVILKLTNNWFSTFQHFESVDDTTIVSGYHEMISNRINFVFGNCSDCNRLTTRLALLGDADSDGDVTAAEARSFLSLLYQQEPMMLMVLDGRKHSLDYFGYCGGLYAVEKVVHIANDLFGGVSKLTDVMILPNLLEPLEVLLRGCVRKILKVIPYSQYIFTAIDETKQYASFLIHSFLQTSVQRKVEGIDVAFSMLDAIVDLSSNPCGLLQSCDVHLGNFGITNDSIVKLVDLDSTYPDLLLKDMLKQKTCSSDKDCVVVTDDCVSACNTDTATCMPQLKRQDLQNICVHFHSLFRREIYSQIHSSFLKAAIENLIYVCRNLPVAGTLEELQTNIFKVRSQLEYIRMNFLKSFQGGHRRK